MKYPLFEEVVLRKDFHEKKLKKGDVATIVDYHPVPSGESGYSLEVFNALGETVTIIVLPESAIEPLTGDEIFTVRSLAVA